jgi:hypothetical protein
MCGLVQKLKGIWPLPGGSKAYVNTLLKILEKINGGLSENELRVWMRATYHLTGEKAIGGYLRVVEVELGLLARVGEHLTLTADGKRLLDTKDYSFLLNLLLTRIVGFEEVFQILSDGHHHSLKNVYLNLVRLCNVGWKKPTTQTLNRLNWLASLGYVDFDRDGYYLTQKGLEFFGRLPEREVIPLEPPVIETPVPLPTLPVELTHSEMIRLLSDLGEIFGFEPYQNVKLGDIKENLDDELRNRTVDVLWRERYRMIPIEVQAHGSIDSLLNRLRIVEPKSSKMLIVATQQEFQRIKSYLEFESRSFKDKVAHISPEELSKVQTHVEFVKNLRKKIS